MALGSTPSHVYRTRGGKSLAPAPSRCHDSTYFRSRRSMSTRLHQIKKNSDKLKRKIETQEIPNPVFPKIAAASDRAYPIQNRRPAIESKLPPTWWRPRRISRSVDASVLCVSISLPCARVSSRGSPPARALDLARSAVCLPRVFDSRGARRFWC
jgi:hypothetical protein